MALQKSLTDDTGTTHPEAYIKANSVVINKDIDKWMIDFDIVVFHTVNNKLKRSVSIYSRYQVEYNLTGDNPLIQAYTYLKTLPEFSGALDV